MMQNIGIIIETDNGKIKPACLGMMTMARQGAEGTKLFAFVMDADASALKEDLKSFGITTIINPVLLPDQQNNPVILAKTIINGIKEFNLSKIIGLSNAEGKDLLPRIAALIEAPLVMDCIYVDLEQNLVKTSRYSGKTIATIKLKGDILILGIRPNAVEPVKMRSKEDNSIETIKLKPDRTSIDPNGFRVIDTGSGNKNTKNNLVEADIIIAGGRGMKNGENFTILFQCAKKLKAAVGASRVAVDSGWVPYSMQVGQTGEKVSPKVYIACGISGSIQHFAGMKTSGMVIAVNTDENAAIMANCDYYIKADVLEIIPELTKLL